MTSYEILNRIDTYLKDIEISPDLYQYLERLKEFYYELEPKMTNIAVSSISNLPEITKPDAINQMAPLIRSLSPLTIFTELNDLRRQLYSKNPRSSSFRIYENLKEPVVNFLNALDNSFVGRTLPLDFEVVKSAAHLIEVIDNERSHFKIIRELIELPSIEQGPTLSLFFSAQVDYRELLEKLTAIETLYNELCRLLKISTSEHPLELRKLEVGSWWVKIFGESKVIGLMTDMVRDGVAFMHRNFTREGQIKALPTQVDAINQALDLSNKLKEKGINTDVLDENIAHSSAVIGKNLTKLLGGEPVVEVNHEKFSVGDEYESVLLAERKKLLLEPGKEVDEK